MIRITLAVALTAGGLTIQAQERLSSDQTTRYAELVGSVQDKVKSTPIPTKVDLKKAVALQDGEYGAMVLPDKALTAESLAKAGPDVIALGQMWLLKLAPLADGNCVREDKLHMVTVNDNDTSVKVPCLVLGVRKATGGGLELLVFGNSKEPLVKAPLKTITATQDLPLDITAERENDCGRLTVKILGKYEADFKVTDPERY